MSWLTRLFGRRDLYSDLAEEMREHLEEKTEQLMHGGMTREEARHAARRAFGNATLIVEHGREVWQWPRLESVWADVKFALRQLVKSPAFTATAVLTLALGIGANTGIFTLTRALLLKSLPVPDPDGLIRIALDVDSPNGFVNDVELNVFLIHSIQKHTNSFSGVFGWAPYDFVLKEDTGERIYSGAVVSGNAFQALGITPAAGRLLTPEDDQRGGGPDGWAAVISHRFWQQHYHADPSIVGRRVSLTDHSVTIVGVAPEGFEGVFVATHPDFYLPLEYEPVMRGEKSVLRQPGNLWLTAWARLKPGVSLKSATAEVSSIYRISMDETLPPAVRHAPVIEKSKFAVRPGGTGWTALRSQYARPLLLLQVLVGVVLLVCCVNLAGLCLARASAREQEFAIRGALGAARSRLMQQLMVESLLLAVAGGGLAIAVAWATDRYLLQFLANRQAAESFSVRPDLATLLVTGGFAVLCALLFGLAPAWLASHVSIEPALRRSGQNLPPGRKILVHRIFVPVQVALTLALVVVAAMLSATVVNLRMARAGFRTENVLFARTDFERLQQRGTDLIELYRRIASRIEQMPGVESASVAEYIPLSGQSHLGAFASADASEEKFHAYKYEINDVGAHYFAALGTKILAGHDFSGQGADADTCILNRSAANAIFTQSAAIGRVLRRSTGSMNTGKTTTRDCQVIGVVEDAKFSSLRQAAPPTVYFPFGTQTERLSSMAFVIHAATLAEGIAAWRQALHELAPGSPETEPIAFSVQFNDSIARERLLSVLSGFFAALALLLSSIGIYGLMASYVTRRTTEIGVRMALGATRAGIFSLVMRQVAILLLLGTFVGGCLAVFAAHSIKAFLFDVNPGSPAIFISAILILALSGFVAAMLPARRAVSIEP
ncbi:MAG TPA: ABC transporter permease, partial [Silvibacterium sp.]|nr:ABC transporter permease [Silvibacterium sp.]